MPFSLSNVPKKNPGRYFEQFVKIVQPIGEGGQTGAAQFCNKGWGRGINFKIHQYIFTPSLEPLLLRTGAR